MKQIRHGTVPEHEVTASNIGKNYAVTYTNIHSIMYR